MNLKLLKYKRIKGQIELKTGLHIGGSKDEIRIGETDNPVIRNPIDGFPYIPGSSLKGKIRTLLEWHIDDKVDPNGDVHGCADLNCPICRIFGSLNTEGKAGPGRAIFRDCELDDDSKEQLKKLKEEKGLMYVEEKYENVIDRTTGTTKQKGLRQTERVPAGMVFNFELDYRVFSVDSDDGKMDENLFNYLLKGLQLLQDDALGGSGSRGYGQILFKNLTDETGESIDLANLGKPAGL